jgi:hypothetical protein
MLTENQRRQLGKRQGKPGVFDRLEMGWTSVKRGHLLRNVRQSGMKSNMPLLFGLVMDYGVRIRCKQFRRGWGKDIDAGGAAINFSVFGFKYAFSRVPRLAF